MSQQRLAILNVSGELLRQVLCLPEGTVINACRMGDVFGDVQLRIESPGLDLLEEGAAIPVVSALITYDEKTQRPVFVRWEK